MKSLLTIIFISVSITSSLANENWSQMTFAGYQAWFSTPKNRSMPHWGHWFGGQPTFEKAFFDLFPYVNEYPEDSLVKTELAPFARGGTPMLYDASHPGVIETHVKWVKEYGLDGLALQRFLGEGERSHRNNVIKNLSDSSNKFHTYYYLMYDIHINQANEVKTDFETSILKIINPFMDISYAKENNKPVICLWGPGFNHRADNPQMALDLIQWFQNKGFYVIGGVPYYWRTLGNDSHKNKLWKTVYATYDAIEPWSVGRYWDYKKMEATMKTQLFLDQRHQQKNKKGYKAIIWPGFSWNNLVEHRGDQVPGSFNQRSRDGGKWLWAQGYFLARKKIIPYIAMFDEFDESTAIMKAAPNKQFAPTGQRFLTLAEDEFDLSADYYLRLTSDIIKMVRGQIPLRMNLNTPFK